MMIPVRPRLGVSACLLDAARGRGQMRDEWPEDGLVRFVDLVVVGFAAASPPESPGVDGRSAVDGPPAGGDELARLDLDGLILAQPPPESEQAPIDPQRAWIDDGFARLPSAPVRERLAVVPVVDVGWSRDPWRRESFLDRLFTRWRMRSLLSSPSRASLVAFHAAHKLLYMAHSPARARELGRLVAAVAEQPLRAAIDGYAAASMAALAEPATPGMHANVLQHIAGYFKGRLTALEKQELGAVIDEFRSGRCGLSAPLACLTRHLHEHALGGWLADQVYFQPYPAALRTS